MPRIPHSRVSRTQLRANPPSCPSSPEIWSPCSPLSWSLLPTLPYLAFSLLSQAESCYFFMVFPPEFLLMTSNLPLRRPASLLSVPSSLYHPPWTREEHPPIQPDHRQASYSFVHRDSLHFHLVTSVVSIRMPAVLRIFKWTLWQFHTMHFHHLQPQLLHISLTWFYVP